MKHYILTLVFCYVVQLMHAQNLVPNGDFESYRECPVKFVSGEYDFMGTDWYIPTNTADYFNRCTPSGSDCCGVPCSKHHGFNETHGGDGMAGALIAVDGERNEYLGVKLKQPLVAGRCYYFEMYVKASALAPKTVDHIGAYFSVPLVEDPFNVFALPDTPQICSPGGVYFSNSYNWQKVRGVYTAEGGEEYLILGNFDPSKYLMPKAIDKRVNCGNQFTYKATYLFFDDVLVTENIPSIVETHTIEVQCTETRRLSAEQTQPNITYRWNDGSTLPYLDVSTAGKYWVEINWNNCARSVDTFIVTPAAGFSIGPDTTLCTPGSFTITPSAQTLFHTYLWSTGSTSPAITVNSPGTYWVRAESDTCAVYDQINVDMLQPFKPDLGSDVSICERRPKLLDALLPAEAGRNYNYMWFMNSKPMALFSSSIDVEAAATYCVVKSIVGCVVSDTITVTTIPAPIPPMIPDSVMCDENPILVNAGNPYFSKLWSTMETSIEITIDSPGTYWVGIANNTPCIIFDTFSVGLKASPSGFRAMDTVFCHGYPIMLKADAGYVSYQWSTGNNTDSLWIDSPGSYALTVFDGFCSSTESTNVGELPAPPPVILTDSIFCEKDHQQVIVHLPKQYTYTMMQNAQSVTDSLVLKIAGTYELRITDALGCITDQRFNIQEFCAPAVFTPNAFSPNGDGINEIYAPTLTYPHRIRSYKLEIYNRWGQLVFVSNAYEKGWDGTYELLPAKQDTYVYRIDVTWNGLGESIVKELKGTVTLLR